MINHKHCLLAGLLNLSIFSGCNSNMPGNKVNATEFSKEIITEHFRMLNEKDLKGLSIQYDNKVRIITTNWDGESIGPAGANQIFHQLFYVSPDAKYLVDNMIINDFTAVVEYDVIGLKEKFNSPVRYDLRNCSIFKIRNNRITSEATYSNSHLYYNK
jgi:hypothetical protein